MKAADRIKGLRASAEKHEKTGQATTAAWYRKQADKVEAEAEQAERQRPWGSR